MHILILAFLGSMIANKQKVFKKSLEIASANVYIDFGFFQKYFKHKKSLKSL